MATRTIQIVITVQDINVWVVCGKYFLNKPNATIYGEGKGDQGYPVFPEMKMMPQDTETKELIRLISHNEGVIHSMERVQLSDSLTQHEVTRRRESLKEG